MNNFWNLVKINLRNTYSLSKQINPKSTKNLKAKQFGILILFIYLFAYLGFYAFFISKSMLSGLIKLDAPYILPTMFMVSASCFIIFSDIFRINGNLFKTKDYDLLNSLPIKSSSIILSKLITIYLENILLTAILMVPAFIVYVGSITVSTSFIVYYFITMLLIPIIPMIIATLIGTIISYISSLFNKKNLVNFIASFVFMIGVFYFSFSMGGMNVDKLASVGVMLVDKFNNIYPMTKLYLNIVRDSNILSFITYVSIPIILMTLYLLIMNKMYSKINTKLNSNYAASNYKITTLKITSPLRALFNKDVKRFYSSYLYVLNCCMGAVFLTISVVALVFFGSDAVNKIFETDAVTKLFVTATPLIIGAFCLLNSTTQASISIEGKSLKLLKSLPVNPMQIFLSKILTNFTIYIPMIFINVTILAIYLKFSIISYLVGLIVPLIYALFAAMFGLIINLIFPTLEWDNEVRVIKQSLASFITVMIGMFLAILPLVILSSIKNVNMNLFTLLISCGLIILNYLMYLYLKTKGVKRFNSL